MKTLILTVIATAFIACGTPAQARDWCGVPSHHFHSSHYHPSYGHIGIGVGWPLFYYPRPAYYYGYAPRYYTTRYYVDAGGYSLGADVQMALARRGYYHGAIDGIIGPQSRSAIYRYQESHGLPMTGRIDGYLLRSLDLD